MNIKELEKAAESVFEEHGIARHSIRMLNGKTRTLEIMIMKEDGSMDMYTCASVCQDISRILDQLDFGDGAYNLDVCSFGAERELLSDQEILNAVNDNVHIDFKNPAKGLDQVEGTLLSYENDLLTVEYSVKGRKKTAEVAKDNVKLIRLAVKL